MIGLRFIPVYILLFITGLLVPIPAAAAETVAPVPALQASSAVLMDLQTGQVLYAKNPYEHLYPASITKIMTALLALKNGRLSDRIVISAYAASQEANKLYLVPGEVHTLKHLLYGLLIDSGNDAAVAIAQRYGGSVRGFAGMMNAEARTLGARDTHFVNPNGLQDPKHYTSAYDMALIARQAMKIPEFRRIVDTRYYVWKGKEWTSDLSNLNQMLWWYPGANGVKTGWTDQAEQTIVVTATRGNLTLLAVLMRVNGLYEVQQEAGALLDFGFENFRTGLIVQKGAPIATLAILNKRVPLVAAKNVFGAVSATAPKHGKGILVPDRKSIVDRFRPLVARTPHAQNHQLVPTGWNAADAPMSVDTLKVSRLVAGTATGKVVGSAGLSDDFASFTVPVKTASPVPRPPVIPVKRPFAWPALVLALISFIAAAVVYQRKGKKKRAPHYRSSY